MRNFRFNQIYVIQSLPVEYNELGEEKIQTGEQLYNDLLRWQEIKHPQLSVFLRKIQTEWEWNDLMAAILNDCTVNGNIPVLHFEIHGKKTEEIFTKGFVLGNGQCIDIEVIGEQLRRINMATQCNLFVTLAVCKGMSLLLNMHESSPMPFIGAIGSFNEIEEEDLYLRYLDFYEELFYSFDIAKAYVALCKANPKIDSEYKYIPADELFIRNYQRYIDEQCTHEAIKERAVDSQSLLKSPPRNRAERRRFQRSFEKMEKQNRAQYYRNAVNDFFMLAEYPENKERFDVPMTICAMKEKSKYLVTV